MLDYYINENNCPYCSSEDVFVSGVDMHLPNYPHYSKLDENGYYTNSYDYNFKYTNDKKSTLIKICCNCCYQMFGILFENENSVHTVNFKKLGFNFNKYDEEYQDYEHFFIREFGEIYMYRLYPPLFDIDFEEYLNMDHLEKLCVLKGLTLNYKYLSGINVAKDLVMLFNACNTDKENILFFEKDDIKKIWLEENNE